MSCSLDTTLCLQLHCRLQPLKTGGRSLFGRLEVNKDTLRSFLLFGDEVFVCILELQVNKPFVPCPSMLDQTIQSILSVETVSKEEVF